MSGFYTPPDSREDEEYAYVCPDCGESNWGADWANWHQSETGHHVAEVTA